VGNQGELSFCSSLLPPSYPTSLPTLFLLRLDAHFRLARILFLLPHHCCSASMVSHTVLALLERAYPCVAPHKSPILAYLASLDMLQCSNCANDSPHSTPSPSPETGTVPDVTRTTLPKRCELPEKEWPLSKPLSPNSARGI
jgi:hypothetical protein